MRRLNFTARRRSHVTDRSRDIGQQEVYRDPEGVPMTIRRTRSKRRVLRPFAVAAVVVVTMAGCHYTRTMTGSGSGWSGPAVCNPDSVEPGIWVPAPGTVKLRLKVSSSNSTQPINAHAVTGWESGLVWPTLWDGVRSTGPQDIDIPYASGAAGFVLLFYSNDPSMTYTFQLTPLDSAGNETSFIDCPPKLD
jgi:hypothetical protein